MKNVFCIIFALTSLQLCAQAKLTPYWESQIDDEKQTIVLKTIYNAVKGYDSSKTVYIHLLLDAQDINAYQYVGYVGIEPSSSYLLNGKNIQLTFHISRDVEKRNYSSFILCFNYDKTLTDDNVIDKVIIPRDIWIQHYSYQEAQSLAANAIDNPMLMVSNISEMNNLISRHSTNIIWINNYPISNSQTSRIIMTSPSGSLNSTIPPSGGSSTTQQSCWCCYGTGYCHVCGGKGIIGNETCPSCHGTCRCKYCDGTGIFHSRY